MNPEIDLFTTTGRMITSDPPLQNLDHKIRLTRSWRTSLAEETEADVPGLEVLLYYWCSVRIGSFVTRGCCSGEAPRPSNLGAICPREIENR